MLGRRKAARMAAPYRSRSTDVQGKGDLNFKAGAVWSRSRRRSGGAGAGERPCRNRKRPDAVQRDGRVAFVLVSSGASDVERADVERPGADDQHDDDELHRSRRDGERRRLERDRCRQHNTGKSPVFKQYCPNASCGTDSGPGYVTSGQTLAANSLTLSSTGASFAAQNGSTGTGPTLQCASACNVDSASPVKIASAASSAGMGTWATTGWSGTSLGLSTPSTIRTLQTNEVYRVDLVWTINSGP